MHFDQVTKHHVLAAAENARDDIGTERGDEHEDRAGNDARPHQRYHNTPEHLKACRIKVVTGLDQPEIKFFDRGIERQHHQRQVDIGHAEQVGGVGIHDLQGALDQTKPHQCIVEQAFVADHLLHRERADQKVRPERDRDKKDPDLAGMWRPCRNKIGRREAEDRGQDGGEER